MTVCAAPVVECSVRDRLPGLLSLALASCLAVTTEMLPVGLLPDIGRAFAVPESAVGLLVGLYAVMVAALAVPLTVVTTRFARKPLLLATLAGYTVSNALVAVAPVFPVLAVGRTIGGITHALFFSLVIGYAPRLVARAQVGKALALAGSGASAGLVLGVPVLTSLGTAAGWRVSFVVLTVLAVATLLLVSRVLPAVGHDQGGETRHRGGRRRLAGVSASNMLVFTGHFTAYTYISVLLLGSGVAPALLGPVLLACGACGLIGLGYAGRGLDRNPRRTATLVVGLSVAAVVVLGATWPTVVAVLCATAVWSGAFGGVPSIYQACAVRARAVSPERAGAWVNSTANVGIAGGSALGAGLLPTAGVAALPWVGAALLVAGLLVILVCRNAFPARP